MSNLQIIEELCKINAAQADIITAQAAALEQLGAVCMEEERAETLRRLSSLIDGRETQN